MNTCVAFCDVFGRIHSPAFFPSAKCLNHYDCICHTLTLPRGMKDFEGQDSAQIEHIRTKFLQISDLYGFKYVDPSPLENLSTLETRSGPAIRDEIYHFKDKGGREVALRFDFTMGLARRASSQRSEKLPSKVSSFGGVFRYDEPQKGRYRYFHQWDLEIFGKPAMEADAEIIEMTSVLFESLGLKDVSIQICHRDLIESKVRQIFGDRTDCDVSAILRAVDKTAKKSRQDIIDEYVAAAPAADADICDDIYKALGRVLDFASIKGGIKKVAGAVDGDFIETLDGWEHLTLLFDSLEGRGIHNVDVNFGIVRGLDYYSGMVFEVFCDDNDSKDPGAYPGALAGGGRYDALTKAFGRPDLGAAGVAGGVERTVLAMRRQGLFDDDAFEKKYIVAVLYAAPETRKIAAQVAYTLRKNGIRVEFDIAGKSLKKQLGIASQKNAHATIIIGPRELQDGRVTLRIMDAGTQHAVPLDKLLQDPHGALSSILPS